MKHIFKIIVATTGLSLSIFFSANAQWAAFNTNIYNTNTGNIGINNGSIFNATEKLQVKNGNLLLDYCNGTTYNTGGLYFGGKPEASQNGMRMSCLDSGFNGFIDLRTSNPVYGFVFRVDNTTGSTERFRINANGNVGIGTGDPKEKLSVMGGAIGWGNTSVSNWLATDQGGSIELGGTNSAKNPSTNGTPYLDFHFGTGAAQDFNMRIINSANNRLDFAQSSNVSVMTLNGTNVGIGTTTPNAPLNVAGANAQPTTLAAANGAFFVGSMATNLALTMGVYADGTPYGYSWIQSRNQAVANNYYALKLNPLGGKVVIGNVNSTVGDYGLYVQKGILTEQVKVAVATSADWADYVFNKEYKLKSINELEAFVKENNHLPNIPSAEEVVKNGIDMAKMDAKLLEKIEELSLYIIEQNRRIEVLEQRGIKK